MNVNEPHLALQKRADGERDLLRRIAARETRALDELYQCYAGPLYSYAFKILSSHEDAEEVLQDTFVRIWKRAPKYDSAQSKPFTWSVMITRGLALDRLRRRSKKSALRLVPLESVEEPHSMTDDCISHLFFSESSRQVRQALDTLSQPERECLEWVIFSETTHQQIAERTQQPLGTVKARIRRGMIKLRTALEHHES